MNTKRLELTDDIKSAIQSGYRNWLAARGFKPRRSQREMIAAVAKTICAGPQDPNTIAIEAGTGTGKTAAYCLAALPIALAHEKTIVISTATISLQEQVALLDLPDIQANAGIDFTYAIAKGRRRYLCPRNLAKTTPPPDQQATLVEPQTLAERMSADFHEGRWDGDMDTWTHGFDDDWPQATTDAKGCTGRACRYRNVCPFFKAQDKLRKTNIIIANHDLLLSHYALGIRSMLPDPADSIVIVDEAHHLADKARQRFALSLPLATKGKADGGLSMRWELQTISAVEGIPVRNSRTMDKLKKAAGQLPAACQDLAESIAPLQQALADIAMPPRTAHGDDPVHRFPLGELPPTIKAAASQAAACAKQVESLWSAAAVNAKNMLKDDGGRLAQTDHLLIDSALQAANQAFERSSEAHAILADYGNAETDGQARWMRQADAALWLHSTPIRPGDLLREYLWRRAAAVIATSATLTSLGEFHRFRKRTGLPPDAPTIKLASPLPYEKNAVLALPNLKATPQNAEAHTEEVAALMPKLIKQERSALVLFASWRQMRAVLDGLNGEADNVLAQGDAPKSWLIKEHKKRIDAGRRSCIVGLASFAEGVDLPGDYCEHVIIAKLPFAVPDGPLEEAEAELVEAEGGNPFMDIALPDASAKLIQACGRLMRSETDKGRVTLLDARVRTKRYGKALIDALPPFRVESP